MHLSTTTSNSSGYSDLFCTLIRRVFGYQNAGEAHLERRPTTVVPEICALLLQEHSFYRNTVSTGTQFYRKAGSPRKKGWQKKVTLKLFMQLVFKGGRIIVHSLVIKISVKLLFAVPILSFYRMSV